MRVLTAHEKKTVRIGLLALVAFLVVFHGPKLLRFLDSGRRGYQQQVEEARLLKKKLEPYVDKVEKARQLMGEFQMDPAKLTRATVVGEASAAIQKAATGSGIQLGPIRETPARATVKEMAQIQFEGTGPAPAILGLLKRVESIGFPMVVDSVAITPEKSKPGQVKLTLTILILDFEQWKKEVKPNA